MRKLRCLGTGVLVVIFLSTAGFMIWGSIPAAPMAEALDALITNETVLVENEEWIVFSPRGVTAETGLIFYPGGRVDPRAYAPLLHQVAEAGYLAVIVPMPLNLAVFSPNKAAEVTSTYPEIESWAVGGHSLGGAMAARFAYQNPDIVQGLVLWAAYPANSDNLSGRDLDVASIYGTLDSLATPEKI
ncbi:MAG: alpha/beta hydrolase, partial [Chloroflexi bacterium]